MHQQQSGREAHAHGTAWRRAGGQAPGAGHRQRPVNSADGEQALEPGTCGAGLITAEDPLGPSPLHPPGRAGFEDLAPPPSSLCSLPWPSWTRATEGMAAWELLGLRPLARAMREPQANLFQPGCLVFGGRGRALFQGDAGPCPDQPLPAPRPAPSAERPCPAIHSSSAGRVLTSPPMGGQGGQPPWGQGAQPSRPSRQLLHTPGRESGQAGAVDVPQTRGVALGCSGAVPLKPPPQQSGEAWGRRQGQTLEERSSCKRLG